MTRLFWHRGLDEWVDYADLPPRSKPKGPMIFGDRIPDANGRDVLNHADGKRYDSKSKFYAAVRRSGAEITGNEYKPTVPIRKRYTPKGVVEDIQKAIAQLRSR